MCQSLCASGKPTTVLKLVLLWPCSVIGYGVTFGNHSVACPLPALHGTSMLMRITCVCVCLASRHSMLLDVLDVGINKLFDSCVERGGDYATVPSFLEGVKRHRVYQ